MSSTRTNVIDVVSREDGGVVVLFALLTPVLALLFALVVDIGNWWVHKRHLQLQVDAAALAGGARFGECFPNAATGNAAIQNEATKYSGGTGATYNAQVGQLNRGTITVLYQSRIYAAGGPGPDDTETEPPCDTPNLMFDVKGTEAELPFLFDLPGVDVVPAINAHARVQLREADVASGSLPLAVPEVNPRHVTATFVNEDDGGTLLAGPFELTRSGSSGSLSMWTGAGSVDVPADTKVGVRIGVGQQSGACAAANGTGGAGYVCYDYDASSRGLVAIAGVGTGGTPTNPRPRVWPITACAGSPFFSEASLTGGATSCAAGVEAVMESSSGPIDPAQVVSFTATVDGTTRPLTFAGGVWSTGYAFTLPIEGGAYDVTLEWRYAGGARQTYRDVQRLYSGSPDSSGPVEVLSLSSSGGGSGEPYAVSAGTHTVSVTVGLSGGLTLTGPSDPVTLRLTGGSRTSAIACDGPGAALFRAAIVSGCRTQYQVNEAGYCPDPSPPAGPATCVPTQTGTMAGPTLQGMDERFASCPPYNWPDWQPGDLRIVKLLITDYSALGGSGTTEIPVTNFGTFYVGGWTGSRCTATNTPRPATLPPRVDAIWGHFFKYAGPDPSTPPSTDTCDPTSLTPCVAVLTK